MNSAISSCEHPDLLSGDDQGRKEDDHPRSPSSSQLAYHILDIPPWYLCILLGTQHFLTALGGLVAVPLILAKGLCLQHDPLTQGYLISTMFFVSGICTLLQVFFGVRIGCGDVRCRSDMSEALQQPGWTPGSPIPGPAPGRLQTQSSPGWESSALNPVNSDCRRAVSLETEGLNPSPGFCAKGARTSPLPSRKLNFLIYMMKELNYTVSKGPFYH